VPSRASLASQLRFASGLRIIVAMNGSFGRILGVLMLLVWAGSLLCVIGMLLVIFDGARRAPSQDLIYAVGFWGATITFCLASIYLRIDFDRP
jgi:hypothetical protein